MSQISAAVPNALASGEAGLAGATSRLDAAAAAVADPNVTNLVDPLVEATQASLAAAASAQVIKASNSLLGTLLDIYA